MEVMGLMLGEFVDEYTVHVVDVFAMPQRYAFLTCKYDIWSQNDTVVRVCR